MFEWIKKLFKKEKLETKSKVQAEHKVEATPERVEMKKKLDSTLHCDTCGRASGYYRITLHKLEKNKYICNICKGGE